MKIALLSHLASPRAPTGAERSLALLARGLAARGHEISLAAPGPWLLEPEVAQAGCTCATIPCRCCWLAAPTPQPLVMQLLRAARFAAPDPGRRRLRSWLNGLSPAAALINCLPHVTGAAAARACGAGVVWHVREILPPGRWRRFFAARLARDAHLVVCVSQAVAAWLREEGLAGRFEVVYNGVVPPTERVPAAQARHTLGLPQDGCFVGSFGQLIEHKGVLELIRAAHLALAQAPALRVVIAGWGRPAFIARIRAEIARGDHPERFHLLPPQPDCWQLLAAVDMLALTTLTPDPLPRSVLEAMAAARPVVAFDVGGVAEMVVEGETGWLLPPGDVAAFGQRLVELSGDEARRRQMGAAAVQRMAERFTLDRHVAAMEDVLTRAAALAR